LFDGPVPPTKWITARIQASKAHIGPWTRPFC
jgi:hypothetical protein